jgi:HAD superfamily hydrolase (TIGR01549 family)
MSLVRRRKLRGVLFDLGSTLWIDQEDAAVRAKAQACELAGMLLLQSAGAGKYSPGDALILGQLLHKTIRRYARLQREEKPGYEPDFVLATLDALRQLGFTHADRALGANLFEALRMRIPASKILFADTRLTLAELKRRGYQLGVVTNRAYGGPLFREDLQAMGLLDYFEYNHIAISIDLGIRKPHPDIFKYVLSRLHVVPEEAAMVGDNLKADVAGAKSLNMLGIWKPKPSLSAEARKLQLLGRDILAPDATIEHLSELLALL